MRRKPAVDAPIILGVVLASAVFAAAIFAISGFAAAIVDSPLVARESRLGGGDVEGASGFALDVSTYSGVPVPGSWMNYLITYENQGPSTEPIQLTDTLPVGAEFSRAWWGDGNQPNAGDPLPSPTVLPGGEYVWELPDLGAGEMRWFHVEIWLPSDLPPGNSIINCATIAPATDETTLEDNNDCSYDLVNPFGPNLGLTTTHQWRLPDYGELSHQIRFWNWGDEAIVGAHITDTYPVGTAWDGSWETDLPGVTMSFTTTGAVIWDLPSLDPGARGQIWFRSALESPATPFQFFTNTVEITIPQGDVLPANNVFDDVAWSGGQVNEVDLQVVTDRGHLWAFAPLVDAGGWITVTTPVTTVAAHSGPDCRCAEFPDIGPVYPGDTITVTAGSGIYPVAITVPDPFNASANSDADLVTGQIDMLDYELIEVALYGGPVRQVRTTMGGFGVSFPDVPKGAVGEVRFPTAMSQAQINFRRRFFTTDVVLGVHVRDDWVEGVFEAGHSVVIEVRESDDTTVKGRAELDTGYPPWWDGVPGFSTLVGDPWIGEPPDVVAGDWVHAWIDSVPAAGQVRAGAITATVEVDTDLVFGTISAPWLSDPLEARCLIAEEGAPEIELQVDPNGGAYLCDFGAAGWDLQPEHQVVVLYWDPEGHRVINQFPESPPELGIEKVGLGEPTTGGNFEYVITFRNVGGLAAAGGVLTDTLPVGVSYLGNTSHFTVTVERGTVVFDVGDIEPRAEIDFSLFTQIDPPVTTPITNTVEISATNVVTSTVPEPSGWANVILPNDTDLTFTPLLNRQHPIPDEDWEWAVEICNVGSTSSAAVILTDTLPTLSPMLSWWADEVGWAEVSSDPEELVAERPTLSGGYCSTVHLLTHVDPDAMPGQQLCNTVVVVSSNDLDPSNNTHVECVTVGGAVPVIEIQKATNGIDADDPPGPMVQVGEPVGWTYMVSNTGNITLTAITVVDDQAGVIPSCPSDILEPQGAMECTASGVAVEGQYANLGTATGTPIVGDPVDDSDPSHYFGMVAGVDIEKATNGEDADDPPGPEIEVGESVEWTYTVRNTGNVVLTGVTVADDQPGVDPDCPSTDLAPDEEMVCSASGVAVEGQYENVGTVTGSPPVGDPVGDADLSHYLGIGGLPFSDGFESGDTSAWSVTVP